jgi:hypothetical protein
MLLVTFAPSLLHIAEPLLHILNCCFVPRVLANVITDLDSRLAVTACDLDDDIQWYRFLAGR